jgi:hypothetical protein
MPLGDWRMSRWAYYLREVGLAMASCTMVERTFAWLGKLRRLAKDDEFLLESSKAWVYAAMIRAMARPSACPQAASPR